MYLHLYLYLPIYIHMCMYIYIYIYMFAVSHARTQPEPASDPSKKQAWKLKEQRQCPELFGILPSSQKHVSHDQNSLSMKVLLGFL